MSKEQNNKPIEAEIIQDTKVDMVSIGDIPNIKSLVNYNVGDINFNENAVLDFIEFIKGIYSQESLDIRTKEVNQLLENGNSEAVYERLKLARKNPAELNNLAKDLEEELKKIKKIWNAPFTEFEKAIKSAVCEIKTISSYLKEVEVDPLTETCRLNQYNSFSIPILGKVRDEIQAIYPNVDCEEYKFIDNVVYYNLGSKADTVYLTAYNEMDFWAKSKNEEILKIQAKAQEDMIVQQEIKMWERVDLVDYNNLNGTSFGINDIIQEINKRVSKDEIYKYLDFKTEQEIKRQEEIAKRQAIRSASIQSNTTVSEDKVIETTKDTSINGVYNITFNDSNAKEQFESWLGNRTAIKWNR